MENSAHTFIDAIPLSRRLGLDVYATPAWLLVIRTLKSMNIH